jgi:DNA-directed RNA polymerases I, II, and III subunit RPABC3
LDINSEIYPMKPPQKFELVLTTTLSQDGSIQDKEAWRENLSKRTLADEYEYVMYGKVYKFDESGGSKSFASFFSSID